MEELFEAAKQGRSLDEEELSRYVLVEREGHDHMLCSRCGLVMRAIKSGLFWREFRCNRCYFYFKKNLLKCKLKTRLPLSILLRFLALFSLNLTNTQLSMMLGISKHTISKLILSIQFLMCDYFNSHASMIGGEGHNVQLDESCVGKRKYNVGRVGSQKWVFGGIDTTTNNFFMTVVPNRTLQTLGPLIEANVAVGTLIYTDCWPAHLSYFKNSEKYGFGHVNHIYNIVGSNMGAHTQCIESLWSRFKNFKRKRGLTHYKYLQNYIDEFRFRYMGNDCDPAHVFQRLLNLLF